MSIKGDLLPNVLDVLIAGIRLAGLASDGVELYVADLVATEPCSVWESFSGAVRLREGYLSAMLILVDTLC